MPKPPPPGPCVHCCRLVDELTWDHVFPKAWYPDDTPENLEKWKIPACRRCNVEYGELEQDLLLRLGMSIGPEEAKATGIAEKGDPVSAVYAIEIWGRLKLDQEVVRNQEAAVSTPGVHAEPALAPHPGQIGTIEDLEHQTEPLFELGLPLLEH